LTKKSVQIILYLILGPGNYGGRVLPHGVAVYREGSGGGATLTPAPPAHAVQPSTVIHQLNNKPDITLPNTPVSVQFSRAIVSGKPNRRMI
jgi:hypothetical protein